MYPYLFGLFQERQAQWQTVVQREAQQERLAWEEERGQTQGAPADDDDDDDDDDYDDDDDDDAGYDC